MVGKKEKLIFTKELKARQGRLVKWPNAKGRNLVLLTNGHLTQRTANAKIVLRG